MQSIDTVKVWDPLVRVFHWTLVIAFFTAYFTEEELGWLHTKAGYVVAALVAFRLVWGVIGTRHARFADFVRRPADVIVYLKDLVKLRAKRYLGHNPAGGVMVLALLIALVFTTFTGMLVYGAGEHAAGPFAQMMAGSGKATAHAIKEGHEFFANLTLALVLFHVGGVIVSSLLHRANLPRAMVTGYKAKDL